MTCDLRRVGGVIVFCVIGLLVAAVRPALAADPLAGTFANEKLRIDIAPGSPGIYAGVITLGSRQFPFTAKGNEDRLTGAFQSEGDSFDFTATLASNKLTLETGGTKYELSKIPVNPLARDNRAAAQHNHGSDTPAPAGTVIFKQTKVNDPMMGCDALTLLVPQGWKLEGGVIWRQNPFDPAVFGATLSDPKSPAALTYYPRLDFNDGIRESAMRQAMIAGPEAAQFMGQRFPEGGYYMGSEIRHRVTMPAEYVRQFVIPRFRKELASAQMVSSQDMPDYAKAQLANFEGMQGVQVSSARVRMEYSVNGVPMEEDFLCTLTFIPLPGSIGWSGDCESYRAPKGELDKLMPMFRTIDHSVKLDLQWYNGMMQVAKLMQDGVRQSIDNAGKLSQYIAQRNNEISDSIRKSYEERSKVMDQCARSFDKVIRGVETYNTPYSDTPLEVPSGYDHVFTNALGEVIMTNDHLYKPKYGDWTEVQPTK